MAKNESESIQPPGGGGNSSPLKSLTKDDIFPCWDGTFSGVCQYSTITHHPQSGVSSHKPKLQYLTIVYWAIYSDQPAEGTPPDGGAARELAQNHPKIRV